MSALILSATSRIAAMPAAAVGVGALLLVAAVLGLSNAVQKSILAGGDPWLVMALRASIAVAVLAPLALVEWRKLPTRHSWPPPLMWLVVASFALGMGLQSIAANYTTASNLGFLINAYVIFMPFLVWLTGRGRPTLVAVLTSGVCFAGSGLLSSGSLNAMGYGDFLCLCSALAYSVWVLAMSRLGSAASLVTLLTCLQWVPVAVLGLAFTESSWPMMFRHLHDHLAGYVILGVFASACAYLLAAFAQQRISACCASVVYAFEGVFGALASYLLLGERLSLIAYLGASLIVGSIIAVAAHERNPGAISGH